MTSKEIIIGKGCVQPQAATQLVNTASTFSSQIMVIMGNKRVNCKSLMGMISLGVSEGDRVHLSADGPDEIRAVTTMAKMIQDGFPNR